MSKSDKDLGSGLRNMMELQHAAEAEQKNTSKAVALFIGVIVFLGIVAGIFYMLGAF